MKRFFLVITLMAVVAGCDRQRDLYLRSSSMLHIESDWGPSLGLDDMTGRATAMLYDAQGKTTTDYFNTPKYVELEVPGGRHGLLVFNGLISPETEEVDLEHISFRNTSQAATFEAVAGEAEPNRMLARAEDEYIASNDMEILTSAWADLSVDGGYARIYRNGELQQVGIGKSQQVEIGESQQVKMIPEPVSYYAQVVVHVTNPASAAVANGALRGFAGSTFMVSRQPSHMRATHQLKFNSMRFDAVAEGETKTGTIETPLFVTFGPPTDLPDGDTTWGYEFEIEIGLTNGETLNRTFDVKNQVLPIIDNIRNGLLENSSTLPIVIEIGIDTEVGIELPIIDQAVGVNQWEDSETIRVVIIP